MILVKVNGTDYINPDMIVSISNEEVEVKKNEKVDGEDVEVISYKRGWVIYTIDGKVDTGKGFNVRKLIKECRDA